MSEISIELAKKPGPPLFRLSSAEGPSARILEISVTQVGSAEPSWRVVHQAARLDDLVQAGMISRNEADHAGVAELQFWDRSLLDQTAIAVSEFRYGEVPVGMYELAPAKALASHRLYEVRVSGKGEGELQFYA
jgi:hypothetical protein